MTEEKINAFRQADTNLRDALRMEEAERPQMPADLNERLMQRMADQQQEKKPRRIVWPWMAAACVAGVMMIWLTPPKEQTAKEVAQVQAPLPTPSQDSQEETVPVIPKVQAPAETPTIKVVKKTKKAEKNLLAQETPAPKADEANNDLAIVKEDEALTPATDEETVTLTERDIPMTRPENYKHTPEELALLKKQANEAYLKWVELELEISKYNLEQTAQK